MKIIDLAEQAPTGGNVGSRRWIVVRDQAIKDQLSELYRDAALTFMSEAAERLQGTGYPQERVMASARYLAEHAQVSLQRSTSVPHGTSCGNSSPTSTCRPASPTRPSARSGQARSAASAPCSRAAAVAALEPRIAVAGHKRPELPDDDIAASLGATATYIRDFLTEVEVASGARDLVERMQRRYPEHGKPSALILSAVTALKRIPPGGD